MLCAVVLMIVVNISPWSREGDGPPNGPTTEIPYNSHASVYRQKATYVTPLPSGSLDDDEKSRGSGAATLHTRPPSPQEQPPRGVQTRARRQDAVEEEIDKYLASHGIHRKRRLRVRFHIVSNFVDWRLCTALGSAALGGVSIPVSGFDSPYSNIGRFAKYVEFADREGLDEDDIIVTMDGDIIWSGADFVPFLRKFARFSPGTEAELDVAAVRAWEDYGEKKAPLFMRELRAQANGTGVKRPDMQMAPLITHGEQACWWGQRSAGFVRCGFAFAVMDHLIEVARNHVSSYQANRRNRFVSETGGKLRAEVLKMVPESSRWMLDDMLRLPNASSPYTTKTPRDRSDPLFYRPSVVNEANPTALVNSGLQVSRVWALRRYAQAMNAFVRTKKPVPEEKYHQDTEWKCDQAVMAEIYTRARLFEVEHNLLTGPPLSARKPPVPLDPRFGLPGLIGVDRRTEMAVLGSTLREYKNVLHHSAYLNRHFPARFYFGLNVAEVQRGSTDPKGERLDGLTETRGGVLVTPPLVWRSATAEDQTRGYVSATESDPDVVRPPFIHYAGPGKSRVFRSQRHLFSWLVAARHDRRARRAFNRTLHKELVELWYEKERVYVDYLRMCRDPTQLPLT